LGTARMKHPGDSLDPSERRQQQAGENYTVTRPNTLQATLQEVL
jgi:hypothetical protein